MLETDSIQDSQADEMRAATSGEHVFFRLPASLGLEALIQLCLRLRKAHPFEN